MPNGKAVTCFPSYIYHLINDNIDAAFSLAKPSWQKMKKNITDCNQCNSNNHIFFTMDGNKEKYLNTTTKYYIYNN